MAFDMTGDIDIDIPEGSTNKQIAEAKARLQVYREDIDSFENAINKAKDYKTKNIFELKQAEGALGIIFALAMRKMEKYDEVTKELIGLLERQNEALKKRISGTTE